MPKLIIAVSLIVQIATFNRESIAQDSPSLDFSAMEKQISPKQSRSLHDDITNSPSYPDGLGLIVSFTPFYSALSDESMRNYALSIGISYNFDPRFSVAIRFFTGEEMITDSQPLLVRGKLLLGAGSISFKSYVMNVYRFRFYTGLGIDLQTILTDDQRGYNGNGFHIFADMEYFVSRNFSLGLGCLYKKCYYESYVDNGNWAKLQNQFNDNWFGLTIAAHIYFNEFK